VRHFALSLFLPGLGVIISFALLRIPFTPIGRLISQGNRDRLCSLYALAGFFTSLIIGGIIPIPFLLVGNMDFLLYTGNPPFIVGAVALVMVVISYKSWT
jgi:hypothetical protein